MSVSEETDKRNLQFKWAEKAYPQLVYYKKHPQGAHFAAFEQPQALVEDSRAGFRSLR